MTPAELTAMQHNTRFRIAQSPRTIVLTPQVEARTATGGTVKTDGVPRKPQTFSLILQGEGVTQIGPQRTSEGFMRIANYLLLGMPDARVDLYDYWWDGSTRYEVVYFLPPNGYELRAMVVGDGPGA